MTNEEKQDQMLKVLKRAYLKHHFGNEDIGWEELANELCDVLCNVMGSTEFIRWAKTESIKQYEQSAESNKRIR